ncbi:MAG: hypothetical protein GXP63_01635 [DPANN group archaeon]|nr:hypothetical protein [DPANN group archaeon]
MISYDRRSIETEKKRLFPEAEPEPEPDYHYLVLAILFGILIVIGTLLY